MNMNLQAAEVKGSPGSCLLMISTMTVRFKKGGNNGVA
jgi:hypothetical protein